MAVAAPWPEVHVRYAVRVHPRAARERLALHEDDALEAWVTAPAVEGRANAALLALLAARLRLRRREVTLLRGERGREKLVELPLDPAAVRRALDAD
ncbi:MAG TPA: DUF167 family protein [Chloroflexota bacterium]|nr:DUF167 family protein [Chloroflexota bacterium]